MISVVKSLLLLGSHGNVKALRANTVSAISLVFLSRAWHVLMSYVFID